MAARAALPDRAAQGEASIQESGKLLRRVLERAQTILAQRQHDPAAAEDAGCKFFANRHEAFGHSGSFAKVAPPAHTLVTHARSLAGEQDGEPTETPGAQGPGVLSL